MTDLFRAKKLKELLRSLGPDDAPATEETDVAADDLDDEPLTDIPPDRQGDDYAADHDIPEPFRSILKKDPGMDDFNEKYRDIGLKTKLDAAFRHFDPTFKSPDDSWSADDTEKPRRRK